MGPFQVCPESCFTAPPPPPLPPPQSLARRYASCQPLSPETLRTVACRGGGRGGGGGLESNECLEINLDVKLMNRVVASLCTLWMTGAR